MGASEYQDALEAVRREAIEAVAAAEGPGELDEIRVRLLGRKGRLTGLLARIGSLDPAERPRAGQWANEAKTAVADAIARRTAELADSASAGPALDVTAPGLAPPVGGIHPVSIIIEQSVGIFRSMGFDVADGPDIETEYYNFDALNTPADHPSRDVQDTFYLPDGTLLRTQTSPVQIRVMERHKPPVRIVAPGRCYRHDTPDATHSANFHQIEGLYVDRDVTLADLKATLTEFARRLLGPEVRVRFRPHFFPFTEPSVEYDFSCVICGGEGCRVCKRSGWLEISGAGMVNPKVFEAVGYDPEVFTGFAFGMGVERIAMILYRIDDIRLLYENDVRFLRQFPRW